MPTTMEYFTSGGRRVTADLFLPKGTGRHPAVLILHGMAGLLPPYRADFESFAAALVEKQIAAVMPHYLEEMDSELGIQAGAAMLDRLPVIRARCSDALRFMRNQSSVNAGRLGVIGFSLGGHLALGLGMSPPTGISLKAVVDFFGPTTAPPLLGSRASLPPVLVQHGTDDAIVPISDSVSLVNELRGLGRTEGVGYEFVSYPGQGHGFTGADLTASRTKTVAFLETIL